MSTILISGGCGYIGSHTAIDLLDNGYEVIIVDNNARSSANIIQGIELVSKSKVLHYNCNLCDYTALEKIFLQHPEISGIIHFAAYKSIPESVTKPLMYYSNNLNSLLNILQLAHKYKAYNFIFSSSCSVYGNVQSLPVNEDTPLSRAESPYARTKQMGEEMIRDFSFANQKMNCILLRYFNPGGCHPSAQIGEVVEGKTSNVIPILIKAQKNQKSFTIFGDDYPTRDGSCIRDYIHVMDLSSAHTKSLTYLEDGKNQQNLEVFNVGIGQGVTVFELVKAFEKASGKKLNCLIGQRRPGDIAAIYADYDKAKALLNWTPKYSIDDIVQSAWDWEKNKPTITWLNT